MRRIADRSAYRKYSDLETFVDSCDWADGIHEINHLGLPLHFKLRFHSHASPTVVVFSHMLADGASLTSVPRFNGDRLTEPLKANVILVSDPSMLLSNSLRTTFYAGNPLQPTLQKDIASVCSALSMGQRLIFFGTSSGGFAALVSALHSPGSMAFVSNPVVNFRIRREPAEEFLRIVWGETPDTFKWNSASFIWDVVKRFEVPVPAKVVYHQNPRDRVWEKWQYGNFAERYHPQNEVVFNRSDVGPGHVFPTNTWLYRVLRRMVEAEDFDAIRDVGRWELRGYGK